MNKIFQHIIQILLSAIRPLYTVWLNKKAAFFTGIRQSFQNDPYLCGMIARFNLLHEGVYRPAFEKVQLDPQELAEIRGLAQKGTLVYVMKNRGQLEYSFFNHLFLKEGIPLARFANGARTVLWKPVVQIFRALLGKLDDYYQRGLIADPIQSGYLENVLVKGESVLLNLKVSREMIFGVEEDTIGFIPPLIEAAKKSVRPVYLVTQQFLYDRHPEKSDKSFVDLLFGEKSNPGMFRKLILFLMSYRKRASIKFGEALDLKQFLSENPKANNQELALKLKALLLARLSIERKSITGPPLISREKVLDKMLRSPSLKSDLALFQKESGRSLSDIHREVYRHFREIAASVNYSYIDLYDRLIAWLTNNFYDGLHINTDELTKLKKVAGKYPIVLVPSHKSHIDYLLLSHLFYNHDLTLPHVCAGINLNFWPVGRLLRRGGAFFIRRSFAGKRLYKMVLQHYLQTLICEGFTIEFFIEGTRSRTGKLLKPRMGILSMLMQAYQDGVVPDIYFVPISIHYERILEQKSYIEETLGAVKEKENVKSLIKASKVFGKKYGKVFIRFAEPQSLKAFFKEEGIQVGELPMGQTRRAVERFAYRLTYNINRVSVVTSTSLVSSVLLSYPAKGIPEKEIIKRVGILHRYLKYKGVEISDLLEQKGDWAVYEALHQLCQDRLISSHQDFWEKFYTIEDSRRMNLDYHKNNAIHFFISLVCFSKILDTVTSTSLTLDEVKSRYENLKTILRHEFTFSERDRLEEHLKRVIDFYVQEGLLEWDALKQMIHFKGIRRQPVFRMFVSLLDNYFEAAYFTLLYLRHVSFEKIDIKRLVSFVLEKGRLLYLKGELHHPEALNQFYIRNALLVFEDLGMIVEEKKGFLKRQVNRDLLDFWQAILEACLGLAYKDLVLKEAPNQ